MTVDGENMLNQRFIAALIVDLIIVLFLAGCTITLREKMLFIPSKAPVLSESIQRHNLEIPLPEGEALRGWELIHPEARANLIYFFGNGETILSYARRLYILAERFRLNVFCLDYRGYGASDGTPSIKILREDAIRIFDGTAALRNGLPTIVMGFSIGTVPAVHLAAQKQVDGLVLMAPVSSVDDVLPAWKRLGPWYMKLFKPFIRLKPEESLTQKPQPVEEMKEVRAALLVVHGEKDRIVPLNCGRKMHDAASSASKVFIAVPGADHNDLDLELSEGLPRQTFEDLLNQVAPIH